MTRVSEPLKALVEQGQNAKHVKDCTELFLGNQGFQQLAGFERLVNLEVLWINDNNLVAINNLDNNIRVKQLYAHNNHICSLKGSLLHFKFLTHLDLSHNQLRDLKKLLRTFQKMHFLQDLNLQGNPCCEEPDYRLLLIHAIPSLQVLDQHQVSTVERLKAAAQIGHDVTALTAAFGSRVPQVATQHTAAAAARAGAGAGAGAASHRGSVLELELQQAAGALRSQRQQAAEESEQALYAANPDAVYWAPHGSLPPPPGVLKAQQAWAAAAAAAAAIAPAAAAGGGGSGGAAAGSGGECISGAGKGVQHVTSLTQQLLLSGIGQSGDTVGIPTAATITTYTPKDIISIQCYHNRSDAPYGDSSEAAAAAATVVVAAMAAVNQSTGCNEKYLKGTFRQHLTERSWEAAANTLRL